MNRRLVKLLVVAVLGFGASGAAAQMPPMSMEWAIQSQLQNQAMGEAMALQGAMMYLNTMQALRAQGYTGPPLPTGITPQSLQESIAAANAASNRYIAGSQANSAARSRAVNDWTMRAIRGCTLGRDQWGNVGYIC